ncbi:sensor histidine kinase [Chitinophaga rhizophila]|uniref:Histidine kinase n=1 Tax=Chitinophaga rhizophila TaxID=2866212 RepID=A0ABS7GBG0_9BACT|nr:histidine kinase [Chitinophaga rhizophila]MBW8684999.1 histidine kinase [Chitinophaga rhizophila]
MKKIPVRSLIRVSLAAPLCIALLVGLTSSVKDYSLNTTLIKSVLIYFGILAVAIYNLLIMMGVATRVQYGSRRYKIIRIMLSFIGLVLINYLLFRYLLHSPLKPYVIPDWYEEVPNRNAWPFLYMLHWIVVNILVVTIHNYVTLSQAKADTELENARLKFANTEAINQLLKQQIHPHFLFNALNTLKSLIRRHPEKAEEYLIHLSDFLRASISKGQRDIISLKDELKLSMDYLEMQKMRAGEALKFDIHIDESSLTGKWLPAFSLQPLLENAIKHNILTTEDPLYLDVIQEGEYLKVVNNLQVKHLTEGSTGCGLMNLSERYRMLAGEDILIEDDGKTFTVKIKILRHAGSHHRG